MPKGGATGCWIRSRPSRAAGSRKCRRTAAASASAARESSRSSAWHFPRTWAVGATSGSAGCYVMPGLLMGLLQVGWFAVNTAISTQFILNTFGSKAGPGSVPFILIGILWGYGMAYIGVMGIQYVAKLSRYLIVIPAAMV